MRRLALLLGLTLLACGKEPPPPPPPPPPAEPPAPKPPPENAAKIAALKERRAELERKVREGDQALSALAAKQNREREELGDLSADRARFRGAAVEARQLRGEIDYAAAELTKLKGVAEGPQHPKLLELRKEAARVDGEIDAAISVRREEQMRLGQGQVDEAPVAREIRALRAAQEQWFDATTETRARPAPPAGKRKVNDAYRAWLKGRPECAAVVARALAQPLAGKGATPDRYDFTNLEFFILCQTLEHELDKLNIDVERQERAELRLRVEALEKERDRILAQIDAMQNAEGGEDLRRYDEMVKFVQGKRASLDRCVGLLEVLSERLRKDDDLKARHEMEYAEAEKALQAARGELAAVVRELRTLRD